VVDVWSSVGAPTRGAPGDRTGMLTAHRRRVVAVRTSWRSWFWNLVLFAVTLTMAAISVGVTVQEVGRREPFGVVVFVGFSAWLCWMAGRALLVGVYARPQGIVTRNPGLTRTIP
jgi:hypothetical protein